ncbi:MAG: divalent-cation tolerance protein CutA [Calditrichia bacterium]
METIIVYCTVPDLETANSIANHLVQNRLAACCNIVPGITSVYRWQGKVETDSELLLLIKTRQDIFKDLEKAILELHPYEVPEIIAAPMADGHENYLKWVDENVRRTE